MLQTWLGRSGSRLGTETVRGRVTQTSPGEQHGRPGVVEPASCCIEAQCKSGMKGEGRSSDLTGHARLRGPNGGCQITPRGICNFDLATGFNTWMHGAGGRLLYSFVIDWMERGLKISDSVWICVLRAIFAFGETLELSICLSIDNHCETVSVTSTSGAEYCLRQYIGSDCSVRSGVLEKGYRVSFAAGSMSF